MKWIKLNRDLQSKLDKFRNDKRAYYSFMALALAFFLSLPAELVCNVRPLAMTVDGKLYLPILFTYTEKEFGGTRPVEPDYKSKEFMKWLKGEIPEEPPKLKTPERLGDAQGLELSLEDFDEEGFKPGLELSLDDFEEDSDAGLDLSLDDFEEAGTSIKSTTTPQIPEPQTQAQANVQPREVWMLWPPVRYDYKYIPTHSTTGQIALASPLSSKSPDGSNTIASSWKDGHYLGTDDRGRDVLARLIYGFRISMLFGLSLAITGTIIGCILGGIQGYFGGWIDLIGQRLTEIWGSIPRLYILIILSSFLVRSTLMLFVILNLTAWMGIAAYIRAEFLKGRNLEYVKAARALGAPNTTIMRRHILPNSLTPVITFFPFEVTAGILALVSLDYLNLGVPSPAPSMGELLSQGKNNLQALWILLPTFAVLTSTLTLLTFVGDGIRNAFDPRKSA